ncbi:MAG: OB-fold protein [Bacteroidota bacterium]
MFRSEKFKIFLVVLLALVAAGGYYAYTEYNRRNPNMADLKADHQFTLEQVLREFEANDSVALKKYADKILEVGGPVKAVEKDDKGFITLVLGTEGLTSSVRCVVDSIYTSNAVDLTVGSSTRVRGVCVQFNKDDMGLGADLILNRCYPIKCYLLSN